VDKKFTALLYVSIHSFIHWLTFIVLWGCNFEICG